VSPKVVFPDDKEVQSATSDFIAAALESIQSLIEYHKTGKTRTEAESAEALAKLELQLKALEHCHTERNEIKAEMREIEGPKEKKKPKTRIEKLRGALLAIARLIPPELSTDILAMDQTEDILQDTLEAIKQAWNLDQVKVAKKDIKTHFAEQVTQVKNKEHIYGEGKNAYDIQLEVPGSTLKIPSITIMANSKQQATDKFEGKKTDDRKFKIPIKGVNTKSGDDDYRYSLPKGSEDAKIAKIQIDKEA
jgi:hypothetical protein